VIDWLLAHRPDPRKVLVFHLMDVTLWMLLTPPALIWWRESVVYLVLLSQGTAVVAALAGLAAHLADMRADPAIEVPPAQSGQS
jgi:hypothetical protein